MFIILSLFVISLFFVFAIERTKNTVNKNRLIFFCLLYLSFISGTRLIGGLDFPTYEGHYNSVPTFPIVLDSSTWNQNYEIGYTYICAFFRTLGISFYGFCLLHAVFFYFCLWKGLSRYTKHFGIVILVFLYKLCFYNTFISMRQSLTVEMFFLIVQYIVEKKWIKYYICVFFISKIHNGALLLYLLYPITYLKLTKKRIFWLNIIFLPTIFIGLTGIDVLGQIGGVLQENASNGAMEGKIDKYFGNENLSPIGIFHTLEYFLIMFVLYKNIKLFDLENKTTKIVIWLFLCLLPLFTLLRGSEVLTREKDYFTIFYAVILGVLIDRVSKGRSLIWLAVVSICAFGYYRYVILFDGGHFLTYHSWLFDPFYTFFQ